MRRTLLSLLAATAGVRRISNQQLSPLRALGVRITPELIEKEKWNAFWDAPLNVPGVEGINPGTPRKPEEIRRGVSKFAVKTCAVKTDGARLEASFDGFELGIFAGRLQFTVYRGSNLIRMEAIARTEESSVAYKYDAGLKGFPLGRVSWLDTSRAWQKYEFGGSPNENPVPMRARNRVGIIEAGSGSLAFFPPPHKFFFAREIEMNLGFVYYRKDNASSFSAGVRQAEQMDEGSIDLWPSWLPAFRALGVNIAMMSDFHGDGHAKDPGPLRLAEQKVYFDGCRRHSDKEFLIMPGEEPDAHFGGHYTTVFPKPVYWTHVRGKDQPLVEQHPPYGKVYHTGSEADELEGGRFEADIEWTFPLEFLELVWGDGKKTERQVMSAKDQAPLGRNRFAIPFDKTGRKWVRFAVWDSAGNGAFSQPVHF